MKILFLTANPPRTQFLDLEEELRSLELELRGVRFRDSITLIPRHAVRPDDLVRYAREDKPNVIHFSGHGSKTGIILRDDDAGTYRAVKGANLKRFLEGRGIDVVVLNACYSKDQSDAIRGAVKTVVGTTDVVGDEASRRFTQAFYRSLGNGLSVGEAFRDGGDAVALHNLVDVFHSHGDLDLTLVGPPANAAAPPSGSGRGGNATLAGSGTAIGGRGGDAGRFGHGGDGGNAEVQSGGHGVAIGGPGGHGGQYGRAGDGGSVKLEGHDLTAGGEGGSVDSHDLWSPPARSGYEIAMEAQGQRIDPKLRQYGRGGMSPGYALRYRTVEQIREEYFRSQGKPRESAVENVYAVPLDYVNEQLAAFGLNWRARIVRGGDCEFYVLLAQH